jgi:hypothetical protein
MVFQLDYAIQKRLLISPEQLSAFCQDWKINELALFGSILRSDFRDDSDIDVLVTFDSDAKWSLLDWVTMREQLKSLFCRDVDIAEKQGLKNPYRRYEILNSYQVIYVAE